MREELLEYYERELAYLRQLGGSSPRNIRAWPAGCCWSPIAATIRT